MNSRECLDNEQHVLGDFRERRRKKMMAALDPEVFEFLDTGFLKFIELCGDTC